MSETTDPQPVLTELAITREEMVDAVSKMRNRNFIFIIVSVISIVLCIVYLWYAAIRFGTEVTPGLVAANVEGTFMNNLPQAKFDLEKNLKKNAPKYVNSAFDQLQGVPQKYTGKLESDANTKISDAMPQVQQQLYQSMKSALDQSLKTTPTTKGMTDQQRMKAALAAVGDVYATQTVKFVNKEHADYSTQASAFIDYLATLGRNKDLDKRDQLYRQMFRTAFALVSPTSAVMRCDRP